MGKKKDESTTVIVHISLNLTDPYQREFAELLSHTLRNKGQFAGIMAHQFLKTYNLLSPIYNEEDFKNFISMYPTLEKLYGTLGTDRRHESGNGGDTDTVFNSPAPPRRVKNKSVKRNMNAVSGDQGTNPSPREEKSGEPGGEALPSSSLDEQAEIGDMEMQAALNALSVFRAH